MMPGQIFPMCWVWNYVQNPLNWEEVGAFDNPLWVSCLELEYLGKDRRSHLTMHKYFKKLVAEDRDFQRMWQEELLLIRSDDHALFGWRGFPLRSKESIVHWVFIKDEQWVDQFANEKATLLKFIENCVRGLDVQPVAHLIHRDNCMARMPSASAPFQCRRGNSIVVRIG